MSRQLTPHEEFIVDEVRRYWLSNQNRDVPFDEVEQAVNQLYQAAKLPAPKTELHDGPKACADAYRAECERRNMPRPKDIPIWSVMWWQSWASYYEGGVKIGEKYNPTEYKTFRDWCWAVPICIPLTEICYVSRWPIKMTWDEQFLLHCDDGPCMEFRDGYKVWQLHGVRLDEQIIMRPESQTTEQIAREGNEEVRRIRIERFAGAGKSEHDGWLRYIRESGAVKINAQLNERDGQWEELYEMPDGSRRLIVSDPSTGRKYCLGVNRESKNTREAQQWMSHGLDDLAIHRS